MTNEGRKGALTCGRCHESLQSFADAEQCQVPDCWIKAPTRRTAPIEFEDELGKKRRQERIRKSLANMDIQLHDRETLVFVKPAAVDLKSLNLDYCEEDGDIFNPKPYNPAHNHHSTPRTPITSGLMAGWVRDTRSGIWKWEGQGDPFQPTVKPNFSESPREAAVRQAWAEFNDSCGLNTAHDDSPSSPRTLH